MTHWLIGFFFAFGLSQTLIAQEIQPETLYNGKDLSIVTVSDVASSIEPGTVVIVSEIHNLGTHHSHQVEFLKSLKNSGKTHVSVGMEFFAYPQQHLVDAYLAQELPENDFLTSIRWGSIPFSFYTLQVWFPLDSQGTTLALNSPRSLSGKIARGGLDSLTDEDRKLLPPNFEIGNEKYFERFRETMGGGHVPPEKLLNYFTAQSLWDDTMAWISSEYLKQNPEQILVIIVGDFHNIYGGGLPDRLKKRGVESVVTVSQVNLPYVDDPVESVGIHPKWGQRADYVWTSSEMPEKSISKKHNYQKDFFQKLRF